MSPRKLKILVVDAALSTQLLVKRYLERNGFDVICAGSEAETRAVLKVHPIQLLLMDSSLSDLFDENLIQTMCEDESIRFIVYTSKGKKQNASSSSLCDADKHIEQPFDLEEIFNQVHSLLTHHPPKTNDDPNRHTYAFGDWYINTQTQQLTNKDHLPVGLSAAEYQLLMVFITYPGIVLSREFLLQQTRGRPSSPFDRTIDVRVGKLRKILESNSQSTPLFETIRKEGYVLNSRIKTISPLS